MAALAGTPRVLAAQGAPIDDAGYRILTYRDGAEIEITGTLTDGVAEALARKLKATPQAKVLHLNSFGGLSHEGSRLFELIRSRGLVTYASGWCYSACTTAFFGGRERWIAPDARLGFHKAAGGTPDSISELLGFEGIVLGAYVDIPADFVRKAQAVPHDTMWYPTIDELRHANVVTNVAEPGRFADTGFGDRATRTNVAAALMKLAPYDSIRRLDPAAFDALSELWLAFFTGAREDISEDAGKYLGPLFDKYVAVASDESIIAYTTAIVEIMESQRGRRPDICLAIVTGSPAEALEDANEFVSFILVEEKNAAYNAIFATASTAPQAPPGKRESEALRDRVERALGERYGSKVQILNRDNPSKAQWAEACDMWAAYLREMLALKPAEASRLLRYIYSDSEEEAPEVESVSTGGAAPEDGANSKKKPPPGQQK